MELSIIIPTRNEAPCLARLFGRLSLLNPPPKEIVLVDGGSTDDTVAIAHTLAQHHNLPLVVLTTSPPSRSRQMNLGATTATGNLLCFLHADTLVPEDLVTVIRRTLATGNTVCGGFISLMAGPHTTRWGISLHNLLKTYYAPLIFRPHLFFGKGLRLLFGDQVMFCRHHDFHACGGFDPQLPIMEEADLCLKLCRRGRIRQVNRVVQSSDRRVAAWGPLKANGIYLMIGLLWGIGVPATVLKRFYDDVR